MNVAQALAAAIEHGTDTPMRTYRLDRDEFGTTVTWEAPGEGCSGSLTRPDYDADIATMVAHLRRLGFSAIA